METWSDETVGGGGGGDGGDGGCVEVGGAGDEMEGMEWEK